jgi:ATP-dependent Clp protease adaptor protein ClpS
MSTRTTLPPDLVVEKLAAKTAPPPMFRVILLNDDYTPMEFVVHILEKFFGKSSEDAVRVMLQVHHEGKGVCGVYPHDIDSSRVAQVAQYARARQHPLQCVLEPASDD